MNKQFIPTEEFLTEMNHQWIHFKNKNPECFRETWETILSAFNNQIAGQKGLHVCDSVCGSGKTLGAEVASVILSKNWSELGTLIVVRLTEQCVDVAQSINEISMRHMGRLIARPMFSKHVNSKGEFLIGKLTEEEILDTQVIVITHENYLRTISGRKKDIFSNWRNGKRKFRVIDEALDLVERYDLLREEMVNLDSMIKLRKNPVQFYNDWQNHLDLFSDIERHMTFKMDKHGIYSDEFRSIIDKYRVDGNEIYFAEMIEIFHDSTQNDYIKSRWKEGQFQETIEGVVDTLVKMDRMIRRSLYFSEKEGSPLYSTGEVILPNCFDSLCVLDATSNVDKIYSLFKKKEQITQYEVDRNVRNFRQCSLMIRPESAGLGLGVTKKQVQPRAKKIIKWANNQFVRGDKVLFAGHKVFMEHLRTQLQSLNLDFEWDVCWWNAIDGRNTWKEFNKLVVLSVNYLPPHYGAVTQISFQSSLNSSINCDEDAGISDSSIAVKIIQLLSRIRTRRVINEFGDCPESEVYLLLPGDDYPRDREDEIEFEPLLSKFSQYIMTEIRKSMNQITVKKWTSFSGFANSTDNSTDSTLQSKFLSWICTLEPGQSVNKKEFENQISDKDKTNLQVLLANPSSKVNRSLQSHRIVVDKKRGRYGGTIFTKTN